MIKVKCKVIKLCVLKSKFTFIGGDSYNCRWQLTTTDVRYDENGWDGSNGPLNAEGSVFATGGVQ
jgi:hypothetical protein